MLENIATVPTLTHAPGPEARAADPQARRPDDLRIGMSPQARAARERRRRMIRIGKRALLVVALAAIAAAVVTAARPRPVAVDPVEARVGPMLVSVEETGITRVRERYLVSAPLSGTLPRIDLHPGDLVRAGQVLARIAPLPAPLLDERTRAESDARLGAAQFAAAQARAGLARGQAALEAARSEAERTRRLAASGAITRAALEAAETQERVRAAELASAGLGVKVAAEEVRRARAAITPAAAAGRGRAAVEVRAPVAGRVLRVVRDSEGVVQAGAAILELGDREAMEVVADVLTTDAVHIRPGAVAMIEGWGGGQPLAGRVREVEPSAFTRVSALGVEEQRVNVVVDLPADRGRWASLGDGYRVTVRITLWQGAEVLAVPISATFKRGDEWAVYRAAGGEARLQRIAVGHRNATHVEVTRGLSAGDVVVAYPGDRVSDGTRIALRGR